QEFIRRPECAELATEFTYVVVKGGEQEVAVIFNMNHFSSGNRQEVNRLSKQLTKKVKAVKAVFVFLDESRSKYYLSSSPKKNEGENRRPLQKLFGTDKLFHAVGGKKFLYSPLSFSQTNHSILEQFIDKAKELLELEIEDLLLDLYCGYGLFSICLAEKVKSVLGVELSRSSIKDAIENAQRNKAANCRFIPADISEESLHRLFPPQSKAKIKVLFDPPRNGTSDGVIELIASKNPAKVLHIFCNVDIMHKELERWKQSGYVPVIAQPFDMFPGTSEVEMMVVLEKPTS
ncbi:MAG: methyltransferase domain-containing protein, partial [Bacteroidota bacterium]|nr:methyltransferase domain-containing protein [Bacteroidota bacterium]